MARAKAVGEDATTGRPTKLTPALQAVVVKRVRAGAPVEAACEAAGIGLSTYYDWVRWGKRGTKPYAQFTDAIARARAGAELDLVKTVRRGDDKGVSNGPAKCAQWLLERTRGKRYAARLNVKVEEELEALLDVVERVCEGKDCGCLEAILESVTARDGGEEAAPPEGEAGAAITG